MQRLHAYRTTGLSLIALTSVAFAAEKPSLPDCALRYGWLMTDHWLTTDLMEQAERAAFYQTNASAAELDSLRKTINTSEQKLNAARELYTALDRTNSPDGLARLAALL